MPVINTLKGTLEVLNALKARIEAVQWTPPSGPAVAAFDKVELFDMTDLFAAFQELLAFKDRVCIVVLSTGKFETTRDGRQSRSRNVRMVDLFFSDRSYKNRKLAMEGDPAKPSPGVFALLDLIVPAVGGLLTAGVACELMDGEIVTLEGQARDELPGRIAYQQGLRLVGGEIVFDLGKAPIV